MSKSLKELWLKIDRRSEKFRVLSFLLLFALILRIPSFFEPYWYGDEAIYLTIGNALNQGKVLYRDIVDHKTPIIYYLAKVGSQLNFRLLLTGWMLVSYGLYYAVVSRLLKHRVLAYAATLVFIIFTTIPLLEGLIPNGELFVLGFVLASLYVLSKTQVWRKFFSAEQAVQANTKPNNAKLLFISGSLMGAAILTKVPAIFDAAAVGLIGWFAVFNKTKWASISQPKFYQTLFRQLITTLLSYRWWLAGLLISLLLSVIYFVIKGAGSEYLQYGLLYNFHYTGTWIPEVSSWFASIWLPLVGKFLFAAIFIVGLTLTKNNLTPLTRWSAAWSMLALVAVTLSNRPYPHYLIQLVLPASILIFSVIASLTSHSLNSTKKTWQLLIFAVLLIIFLLINQLLNFWGYETLTYYQNFYRFATGKIASATYFNQFNALVKDNLQAASIIEQSGEKEVYIWGTNPMLYAQTQTSPPDQFIVLFHVLDLKRLDQSLANIIKAEPPFIVVMKDAETPPESFKRFVYQKYKPRFKSEYLSVWQLKK